MYLATLMLLGSGRARPRIRHRRQAARLPSRSPATATPNAPAMQVADAFEVFSMLDGAALRAAVEKHQPDLIVPEIEAIDTAMLGELEGEGWHVAPSAKRCS